MSNFAVIGVAGFVAPRHLKAIRDTGNRLVAATDPSDSVGVLDQYSFDVRYFREIERFDRHLDKLRRGPEAGRVHWVSVCSPNYLHDAHIRLALRNGADVICEKPLVINPWNLDALQELEEETGRRIATILQLRVHPALVALKAKLDAEPSGLRRDVVLTYVTSRGPWYHVSWKGVEERSGGVATNIGIHFFDLLMWLFGPAGSSEVHLREPSRMAGAFSLARADVRWFLSVDRRDLPESRAGGRPDHVPVDHRGWRRDRIHRRVHGPPHPGLRGDARGRAASASPTPARPSSSCTTSELRRLGAINRGILPSRSPACPLRRLRELLQARIRLRRRTVRDRRGHEDLALLPHPEGRHDRASGASSARTATSPTTWSSATTSRSRTTSPSTPGPSSRTTCFWDRRAC